MTPAVKTTLLNLGRAGISVLLVRMFFIGLLSLTPCIVSTLPFVAATGRWWSLRRRAPVARGGA
ncbi:MAG: hypothetical protein OHK0039_06370 [Bacteroidia bacterium]